MKQFKKLIACVLAATMMLGSATVAFAAEATEPATGTIGGTVEIEGVVDREVFSVVTPTEAVASNAYDFILDPEGLIEITSGEKYQPDSVSDAAIDFLNYGSMYFQVSGTAYDVKSQEATLTNKSSVDVEVSLNATVTVPASNSAVKFVGDNDFTSSTALEVYLAIEGETEAGVAVTGAAISTASGNAYTATIKTELASYDAYSVVVDGDEYKYAIDAEKEDGVTAAAYTFWLTGACNTNADWSAYVNEAEAQPEISLVWSVDVKKESVEEGGSTTPTKPTEPSVSANTIAGDGSTYVDILLPEGVTINYIGRPSTSASNGYKALETTKFSLEDISNGKRLKLNGVDNDKVAVVLKLANGTEKLIELTVNK